MSGQEDMEDQEAYNQEDQQNYEESYESDIQKKFEKELQNMERTRQMQNQQQQEGEEDQNENNNSGYQGNGQDNYEDEQNNQNNQEYQSQDEVGNEQDQNQENFEGNQEYQDENQDHYENQGQDDDQYNNEEQDQQQAEGEDYDQGQNSREYQQDEDGNQQQNNGDDGEKEDVSQKVEQHQNEDGSVTTVTYTTVTKTKRTDLLDYQMPTIQEQDTSKTSNSVKTNKQVDYTPTALAKNNNDLISQVSQQKLIIQSLKEDLKDEREINTIQALEIESLKQLVRKLQGNLDQINKQIKGEQSEVGQTYASPFKTESSRRSEPVFNKVKIYQQMEVEKNKSIQVSGNKSQSRKNSEAEERNEKENSENLYLSTFQKSLWIPQKEKQAERQLYEAPMSEQELKQKALRPLKKITPKDKQQTIQSKQNNNKDQQSQLDVSQIKNKNDKITFDEELNKIAKQNKDQFSVVYKQNKLKMHQNMFEDYQKRKQELIDKRENRIKEDIGWQESLHAVSRAKSVKNISVNIASNDNLLHRPDLRTPSYMERQLQNIKKELQQNSKSISNIPTLENGYSPNSISSIAAGNLLKSIEVKSSVSIPNFSQSPENFKSRSSLNQKKLFLYQVTDMDKNFVPKVQQYKQIKLTQEELQRYEENIEQLKEKNREQERQKLEKLDKLKVSPGYRLMRKSSEELKISQVQSASSQKRMSQQHQQSQQSQIRVSYPTLSGLASQNAYSYSTNKLDKDQDKSLAASGVSIKGNPYSLESNPQKESGQSNSPNKQVKTQIITTSTTNVSQSVSFPAGKNPYVIQNSQRNKEETDQDSIKQGQQKSSSQDNIKPNVQVSTYSYTTTSTTHQNKSTTYPKDQQQLQQKKQQQEQQKSVKNEGNDKNDNQQDNKSKQSANYNKDLDEFQQDQKDSQLDYQSRVQNNKQPKEPKDLTGYKLQQYEYNELFLKGKINNDSNPKHINWEDLSNPLKKQSTNGSNQNKVDQNKLEGKGQLNQQQRQQGQNIQQRQPNTYFQQKYSSDFNQQQIQQQKQQKQPSLSQLQQQQQKLQGQQNQKQQNNQNQNGKSQGYGGQLKNESSSSKNDIKTNTQQSSSNRSIGSKNSQNQKINQGEDGAKSRSPRDGYQKQQSGSNMQENNDKSNSQHSNSGRDHQYGHDPNQIQGVGNISGVKGQFSQFTSQGQEITENQKPIQNKKVPKVREQVQVPKKSVFVENLEKEANQEHKLEIKDEKVYLKPVESDDEPMFGYESSDKEDQEEEEEVEVKLNKRSSLKQSNTTSTLKKRVSIQREEYNNENNQEEVEEELEDEDKSQYRKTPKTPFRERVQREEDPLEQSSQDYEDQNGEEEEQFY